MKGHDVWYLRNEGLSSIRSNSGDVRTLMRKSKAWPPLRGTALQDPLTIINKWDVQYMDFLFRAGTHLERVLNRSYLRSLVCSSHLQFPSQNIKLGMEIEYYWTKDRSSWYVQKRKNALKASALYLES
jgi:hypothetical protein